MEYFKRDMQNKSKEETKLVGAEIPTTSFYYLNLFCVVDSRSKSSIIQPLIKKWEKKARKQFSEEKLIELAIQKGYESWKNRSNRRNSFATVLKIQKRELQKKGVSEKDIEKIIIGIANVKNNED